MPVASADAASEIRVDRLPAYTRAETDLFHWAGRLLVAKGQYITPHLLNALSDVKITSLYSDPTHTVEPDRLQQMDTSSVVPGVPLPFSLYDRKGGCIAREGTRLSLEELDALSLSGQKKVHYFKGGSGDQAALFESRFAACERARLDDEINHGRTKLRPKSSGIPISRMVRRFTGHPRPKAVLSAFEAAYERVVSDLADMWERLAQGQYLWNGDVTALVDDVIDRYMGEPEIMCALAAADFDGPTYVEHCVATSVYCLAALAGLAANRRQARDLVAAALFHDVGYVMIPQPLLEAERVLSKGERRIIFRHIEHNLLLLNRIDYASEDFRIAVYQHHERGSGAGYPTGYRADKIHLFASILAAADILHALVSDRPHRKAYLRSEAVSRLLKMSAIGLVDRQIVRLLVDALSVYPVGACVLLSNGETARVLAASRDPLRPWVGAIFESDHSRIKNPRIRDLSKLPGISVRSEVLPFDEPLAGF